MEKTYNFTEFDGHITAIWNEGAQRNEIKVHNNLNPLFPDVNLLCVHTIVAEMPLVPENMEVPRDFDQTTAGEMKAATAHLYKHGERAAILTPTEHFEALCSFCAYLAEELNPMSEITPDQSILSNRLLNQIQDFMVKRSKKLDMDTVETDILDENLRPQLLTQMDRDQTILVLRMMKALERWDIVTDLFQHIGQIINGVEAESECVKILLRIFKYEEIYPLFRTFHHAAIVTNEFIRWEANVYRWDARQSPSIRKKYAEITGLHKQALTEYLGRILAHEPEPNYINPVVEIIKGHGNKFSNDMRTANARSKPKGYSNYVVISHWVESVNKCRKNGFSYSFTHARAYCYNQADIDQMDCFNLFNKDNFKAFEIRI